MNTTVKLDTAKLEQLAAKLNTNLTNTVLALAFQVEGQAKMNAPVDTGNLRNSIQAETAGPNRAIVGVGAEYGAAVEFGHLTRPFVKTAGQQRWVPPQPYLLPALEQVANNLNTGEIMRRLLG